MIADIVVGLQFGDEGKGKVAHQLAKNGNYTHVLRFNGGCNAGHTIYHDGKKFVTHHIPCGVFHGIRSVIGPGCVIDAKKLLKEIEELEEHGIPAGDLLRISSNAHVITDFHLAQDARDEDIGTTKTGNGPAYRDKHSRKGVRAMEIPELEQYLIDTYSEFYQNEDFESVEILCEGAQGFGLDIDWGDYPYVTSSSCTVAAAVQNGIPHNSIRDVWGVAKIYETYVGAKKFENLEEDCFADIREFGGEYGATTGRSRQISWLSYDLLKTAMTVNGVNKLVVNKVDVLEKIGVWKMFADVSLYEFNDGEHMENWLRSAIEEEFSNLDFVIFSGDPERI
tara:strand:- start:4852 stop:5862 length:1011 start_codon:yes stop_codon:yes gene_type:complete